jgi:hypothetical protein
MVEFCKTVVFLGFIFLEFVSSGIDFRNLPASVDSHSEFDETNDPFVFCLSENLLFDAMSDCTGVYHSRILRSFVTALWASDAFRVNLNPNEPNDVLPVSLSNTWAGETLLNADLSLKRAVAAALNPDSTSGVVFWGALYRSLADEGLLSEYVSSKQCLSFRTWIVPKHLSVVSTGKKICVVEAKLSLQHESYSSLRSPHQASDCRTNENVAEISSKLYEFSVVSD